MAKSTSVASYMLKAGAEQGLEISNLKLQKLVYIAHGYVLALTDEPLIDESPQAWRYGPVINSIYDKYKRYKDAVIPCHNETQWQDLSGEQTDIIDEVLQYYGNDSAIDLVNLTHEPDTPWDKVWNNQHGNLRLFSEIPDLLIKDHFQKAVTNPDSVNGL